MQNARKLTVVEVNLEVVPVGFQPPQELRQTQRQELTQERQMRHNESMQNQIRMALRRL